MQLERLKILDEGEDYQETGHSFTYGLDNNISELDEVEFYDDLATTFPNPAAGKLVYVENEGIVYNWHHVRDENDWRHDNQNNGWTEYRLAYGYPRLNAEGTRGKVSRIMWTRDMGTLVQINLPDGRPVYRQFLEYVVKGDGIHGSHKRDFGVPHGIFNL